MKGQKEDVIRWWNRIIYYKKYYENNFITYNVTKMVWYD